MNVLCIADIHIGEYHNANPTSGFRTKQFMRLAERLVEMRDECQAEEIWILGDFLKVPCSSNKINHILFKFVRRLCKGYEKVRYINGNHDFSSRSQSQDLNDTIISLIRDESDESECSNFIYMDHQILESDGHKFAFMNWVPKQDWTWASGADCYLGHFTYARKGSMYEGQKVIGDVPKLMIFGDIHQSFAELPYVSIGPAIQGNMGDQTEGMAVLLNTSTMEWKHVQIDPDHTRFLRMQYTPVKEEEGYYDNNLTYKVYKPVIKKVLSETKDRKGVLEFDDVDDLINKVILQEGLLNVHSEVLTKNPVYNSIDFDFHLISLDIKGYRSIRDFHMDFDPNQKEVIVLVGQNGSGKSSIIKALQACFMKNRYIKGEKSDLPGIDEFSVNLKFMYGGKLYEINKGDKENLYYAIDGRVRKCNITDLENEIEKELPFIKYLDLLFINADSPNLADKFSESRRIQLIKKFYRLERLSSFKDTAAAIYKEASESVDKLKSEKDKYEFSKVEKSRELAAIDEKLKDLDYIAICEEHATLKAAKEKSDAYQKWRKDLDELLLKREAVKSKQEVFKKKILSDSELAENEQLIKENDQEIETLNSRAKELKGAREKYRDIDKELQDVIKKGKEVKSKLDLLEKSICPTCGQRLNASEYENLKEKYTEERQTLLEEYNELKSKLDAMKSPKEIDEELGRIEKEVTDRKLDTQALKGAITEHYTNKKQYDDVELQAAELHAKIVILQNDPVEKVEFSNESLNRVIQLSLIISDYERKDGIKAEVSELEKKIDDLNSKISDGEAELGKYVDYIDAMGDAGIVMKSILQVLADKFNEEETSITYQVDSGVYRNKPYITFDQYMNVKGRDRLYDSLSSGQKVISDLDFLHRLLVNRVGLIVMDEYLKYSDSDAAQDLQKRVRELNASTIIISTHDDNYVEYTRRLYLSLSGDGSTVVDE